MARKLTALPLAATADLASVAASPDDEMKAMTAAFDAALTGMAYAGAGLCLFAVVWAGFVLMAEGAEGEGRGSQERRVHGLGGTGGGAAGRGHCPGGVILSL